MKRPRRKSAYTSILQIPPELCAKICEEIGTERVRDLLALCRISRLFRDQAQRLIYRTVNLRHCSSKRLGSWCLAVTRHPQLAQRVHTLSLGLQSDISLTSDAAKVARALSKCVNLTDLSIFDDTSGVRKSVTAGESIQGWIISQCPFRLQKFANSYFKNSFLSQFWTAQSDIRFLSIPYCIETFPCRDDQLPNLIGVAVGAISALPTERPLERIQLTLLNFRPNLELLSALSQYHSTLTTLDLIQPRAGGDNSIFEILAKVALLVPTLLHLGITEGSREPDATFAEECPIQALVQFPRLETFFFYSRSITVFEDPILNYHYLLDTSLGLLDFGLAIIKACTTLRRVIVGFDDSYPPHRGRPKNKDLTWTLTRSLGGAVEAESGTHFDFHAVSMFWTP
ncbi:hypothetical protein B0H11DRAFT_642186 [Mycena galericulata]|nr:hypothetical protein B0H11DRAFT_642186 [Mycena galericulata]